jgi:hypothetical protein
LECIALIIAQCKALITHKLTNKKAREQRTCAQLLGMRTALINLNIAKAKEDSSKVAKIEIDFQGMHTNKEHAHSF